MTRMAALLSLILSSSLLSHTAARASILCSWTKVLPNNRIHYSFLRSDPRQNPVSVRLYHTSWSWRRVLLSCTWSDDAAVIRSYMSVCRERAQDSSPHPNENVSSDAMFEAGQCVSLASLGFKLTERTGRRHARSAGGQEGDKSSEVKIHPRVKRGFIVPGTLWCGSGNKAPSYADLGVFSDTDSCCREHDQCKHTILSFHSEYGVFNSNIFTMSHCNCDNKFRSCLSKANDSISDVVGYTFFNLLKMHCFTFSHQLQCAERNWFGMCKKTQLALYADVHPPTLYESIQPADAFMNSPYSNINSTAPAELQESGISDPQVLPTTDAMSTVSVSATISSSITATPSVPRKPTTQVTVRRNELENVLPAKHQVVIERYTNTTDEQMLCDVYKELDECRSKILPQQRKYGFQNTEPRTLYHCNCTTGLFQILAKQRQLTKVQILLLGHVSQFCFLPQDCKADSTCSAVVVKAEFSQLVQRSVSEMEEQHHLQVMKLMVRRTNMRSKRKERLVRLSKLCRRMTRAKQSKKARKHGHNLQ
ncbi:group 3 secretory phospholipase A2 [Kryptolebias marmoratus]|uniref:phospholipase A2 n=1 Tax=Kryptolebias marmoratus TaxID=37003 RepID=A0A3Q3AVN7_KRYMA|nr:group 3 secretory phospholipase A2 [Kryptolebias marmoratus]